MEEAVDHPSIGRSRFGRDLDMPVAMSDYCVVRRLCAYCNLLDHNAWFFFSSFFSSFFFLFIITVCCFNVKLP